MKLHKLTPIALIAYVLLTWSAYSSAEEVPTPIPKSSTRTTNMELKTAIRPEPDSFRSLGFIPPNTPVLILDKEIIQDGKAKVNWYLIEYQGIQGWISGLNLSDSEREMTYSISYESPYGASKPIMGAGF